MALGDNTLQSARGANANPGRKPYMVQTVLNLATALSDKGSALAASDVVPVIAVKKGTMILNAGMEVDTASDGSTFTVDLGMVDADVFGRIDATLRRSCCSEPCSLSANYSCCR